MTTFSCAKDGYKQVPAFTRTAPTKAPVTRVEVECTMQALGAK